MSSWKVRLLMALTMLAVLVAMSVPAFADEWDDRHFGPLHHDHNHDFGDEDVDVDVDVLNVGRHVECLEITIEEEDHHGDDDERVKIFCFPDYGPIHHLFGH